MLYVVENQKLAKEEAIRLTGIQIVLKNINQRVSKEAASGLRQGPRIRWEHWQCQQRDKTEGVSGYLYVQEYIYPGLLNEKGETDKGIVKYQAQGNCNNDGTQAGEIQILYI